MRSRTRMVLVSLATVLTVTFVVSGLASAFPDVSTSHSFAKAIHDLSVRGIVGGFDDGTFRPDGLVTRQQFAKMIVGALNLPVSPADICPFTDVAVTENDALFPDHVVAVAAEKKITQGYSATAFQPGSNISRAHVITMMVRAIETLHPGALKPSPASWLLPGDWDHLSGEHLDNAKLAHYNGLLNGLDYWGVAKDPMTPIPRGEVAQVLYNMKTLLPEVRMAFPWGQAVDFEGARVSVEAPVAVAGDSWNQPAPGLKLVGSEIQIENVGAIPILTNVLDFTLADTDGHSYWEAEIENQSTVWPAGEVLQPGGAKRAWHAFEIPIGATVDSIAYDPAFTDVSQLVWCSSDFTGVISRAKAGQTVNIAPGTYTLPEPLRVPAGVRVVGNGATVNGTLYLSRGSEITGLNFPGGTLGVSLSGADGAVVQGCTFGPYSWSALLAFSVNDCIIDGNTFNGVRGFGANITITGGKRNTISNNVVHGGITSILFLYSRGSNGGGKDSLIEDNVVSGNVCDGMSEEGISFDVKGNSPADAACLEYDRIAAVSGQAVTLSPLAFPSYSGYDLVFLSGALAGRTRSIVGQSGSTFTLDGSIVGAAAGDEVVVGATFKRNIVSGNTVTRGGPAILLYGMAFGNRIEDNVVNSSNIKVLSLDNLTTAFGSATKTRGRAPSGYNTVQNNTVTGSVVLEYYASPQINGQARAHPAYYSFGNNVIGNKCTTVDASEQTCYVAGNTGSNRFSNVTLMPWEMK